MKKLVFPVLYCILISACSHNKDKADISGIQVDIGVQRFDQDFFSMDTLQLANSLERVRRKHPVFLDVFLQHIIGTADPAGITTYFRLYKPVFDSSQKLYANFESAQRRIEEGCRYVKYYFPDYKLPVSIKTVVGPMNSMQDFAMTAYGQYTPDFLGQDFIGISLQFYLGKDFSLYSTPYFIENVAPLYRSRRFSKEYIPSDVMKLLVDDIFPDKSKGKPLIEQLVEKGKQWWMLDKFLPEAPDSVKTGYSQQQLDWCRENEGLIWSSFVKNEDLYSLNPTVIQTYIGEAPFTQGFSQERSPGNMGQWIGWQIVKKFAGKNENLSPSEVMKTEARVIVEEAKYKPK